MYLFNAFNYHHEKENFWKSLDLKIVIKAKNIDFNSEIFAQIQSDFYKIDDLLIDWQK